MNSTPPFLLRLLSFSLGFILTGTIASANQIAARIDLAKVPGSATAEHVITTPGSYYLSDDLQVTKPTGINIQAAGVTLDLNGHEIRRVAGEGGHGILIAVTANGCVVKNGFITGFAFGARAFSEGGQYVQLKARDCSFTALAGGERWIIDRCDAQGNPGIEISAGDGAILLTSDPAEGTAPPSGDNRRPKTESIFGGR